MKTGAEWQALVYPVAVWRRPCPLSVQGHVGSSVPVPRSCIFGWGLAVVRARLQSRTLQNARQDGWMRSLEHSESLTSSTGSRV